MKQMKPQDNDIQMTVGHENRFEQTAKKPQQAKTTQEVTEK